MKNTQCCVEYVPLGRTRSTSSPECLSQLALINRTTWSWVCSAMSRPLISTTWSPSFNRGTQRSACDVMQIRFQICTWLSKSKARKFIFIDSTTGELKLHIEKHQSTTKKRKKKKRSRQCIFFLLHSTASSLMPHYMLTHPGKTSSLEVARDSPCLYHPGMYKCQLPQFK